MNASDNEMKGKTTPDEFLASGWGGRRNAPFESNIQDGSHGCLPKYTSNHQTVKQDSASAYRLRDEQPRSHARKKIDNPASLCGGTSLLKTEVNIMEGISPET